MRDDDEYEYIALPNQSLNYKGFYIHYNSLSMRSEELDSSKRKILFFGDSVINGGEWTNQSFLATSLLNIFFKDKYQFLNISAGSWGPDNCYGYLKKHGDFNANHIFLFVSSHDAYDNMILDRKVKFGRGKKYNLALLTYFDRYVISRYFIDYNKKSKVENELDGLKKFNSGFKDFVSYCKDKKIPFTIYLHPELKELHLKMYNHEGQEIIQFCKENRVNLILGLSYDLTENLYKDNIHLTEGGQKMLATIFEKLIKDFP